MFGRRRCSSRSVFSQVASNRLPVRSTSEAARSATDFASSASLPSAAARFQRSIAFGEQPNCLAALVAPKRVAASRISARSAGVNDFGARGRALSMIGAPYAARLEQGARFERATSSNPLCSRGRLRSTRGSSKRSTGLSHPCVKRRSSGTLQEGRAPPLSRPSHMDMAARAAQCGSLRFA